MWHRFALLHRWAAWAAVAALATFLAPNARAAGGDRQWALQGNFTDVLGHWSEPYVRVLVRAGVIPVPADGLFHPNAPVTRADFAAWMARVEELVGGPTQPPFSDWVQVPDEDREALAAAIAGGLVHGYPDGTLQPLVPIPRVQIAAILGRALERYGEQVDTRYLTVFGDSDQIPAWASEASISARDGIVQGRPNPSGGYVLFAPGALTTRAEAATLIVRYMQYRTEHYHTPPLPKPPAPAGFLLGFWYSNTDEGYTNLQAHGTALNWLVYTGYNLEPDGSLKGYDSPRTLDWVRQHPVALHVMIQNDWSDDRFLHDPSAMSRAVTNLLQVLQRSGYAGLNVDIEGVAAAERSAFTAFIAQLGQALHGSGYQLSVDVPGKTQDDPSRSWSWAYDYAALGSLVDYLVIMAYDYHYPGSDPGPVADLQWVQRVVDYARSVVPPNKVMLGVPAYGYTWCSDGKTGAWWETGMENVARQHNAAIQYDSAAGEATFSYTGNGANCVGWFVGPDGLAARISLARSAGLAGIIAWRLDYDTDDWWPVLAQAR